MLILARQVALKWLENKPSQLEIDLHCNEDFLEEGEKLMLIQKREKTFTSHPRRSPRQKDKHKGNRKFVNRRSS